MAGKALTQTSSPALAYAIDHLTKNQMADMLLDLARRQVGDESASDSELMSVLQGWIDPILAARSDNALSLSAKHRQWGVAAARSTAQHQ